MTAFDNFGKTRHGTSTGYAKHRKLGENPCTPCWEAESQRYKKWLETPVNTIKNRLRARAQARANMDLVRRHKAEYKKLYEQRLAEVHAEYQSLLEETC
jgi:hypothetical protein